MEGSGWGPTQGVGQDAGFAEPHMVELIGSQLRAAGSLRTPNSSRLSDFVNFLEGFFCIQDVVLGARSGAPTRIHLPELRMRLDDITMIGVRKIRPGDSADVAVEGAGPGGLHVAKTQRRLVVMTTAHEISGYAHLHESASVTAFVDASYPRFIPMTNVHVRWLADRRFAGRFEFALLQRSHIIGVATVTRESHRGPTDGLGKSGEVGAATPRI